MSEFLEVLNSTSPDRTIFYGIVLLIALGIVMNGLVGIFEAFNKKK